MLLGQVHFVSRVIGTGEYAKPEPRRGLLLSPCAREPARRARGRRLRPARRRRRWIQVTPKAPEVSLPFVAFVAWMRRRILKRWPSPHAANSYAREFGLA